MAPAAIALEGGFAEPVFDSQSTFRVVMDAMARPGSRGRISVRVAPPAPLGVAAAAIACTLVDADTPFWLDPALAASAPVRAWLSFQTGASSTERPAEAAFALVGDAAAMPAFDRFAQGTQEYPDRSTTLIVEVDALDGGERLAFEGPGIDGRAVVSPHGLPADFAGQWAANGRRFPRGVDLILTAGDALICLPRTTRLVKAEG